MLYQPCGVKRALLGSLQSASVSDVLQQPPSPLLGLAAGAEGWEMWGTWGTWCCPVLCSLELQKQAASECEVAKAAGCGD